MDGFFRQGPSGAMVLAAALTLAAAAHATTVTIVNMDGAGEGFNDPAPAAAVGGNPGTTVGQQRLNVFAHAGQIWADILPSNVEIRVEAAFDALSCTTVQAVLGQASAINSTLNFPGAPRPNTWYPIALANKLANTDLIPETNDIQAQFNSNLNGSAGCLGGVGWYYGYDGNEGTNLDLLPVVLHELGHGLGFATVTNLSTGQFQNGFADIYAVNIRDRTLNLPWTAMSPAQRIASATSGNVVWDGRYVTLALPLILGPRTVVVVNAPPAIAGTYVAGAASFGAAVTTAGVTGNVVLVDDGTAPATDGCTVLVNAAQVAGKVAFIDRGNCNFNVKAQFAQAAGAIAVLIANNAAGSLSPGGTDPTITIPVVGITQADGNTVRNQLAAGVNVTIKLDPNQNAGADPQGRVFLYAPNSLAGGSSMSHFDSAAFPNLLMEPAINRDLQAGNVDLTRYAFIDMGWLTGATDAANPPLATRIESNVPNPFNPSTVIRFDLAADGPARLAVYDLSGRLVQRLSQGSMTAGPHALRWDGRDAHGRTVAAGVYIARLEAGGRAVSHRMVLVK